MTNLEAFIKAHNWQGGTVHQMDIVYHRPLHKAGFKSITDLKGLEEWLDLLCVVFEEARLGICNMDTYRMCKQAYLYRFESKKK